MKKRERGVKKTQGEREREREREREVQEERRIDMVLPEGHLDAE